MISRRRFLTSFAGLLAAGFATGAYALAIEPGWRLRTVMGKECYYCPLCTCRRGQQPAKTRSFQKLPGARP